MQSHGKKWQEDSLAYTNSKSDKLEQEMKFRGATWITLIVIELINNLMYLTDVLRASEFQ